MDAPLGNIDEQYLGKYFNIFNFKGLTGGARCITPVPAQVTFTTPLFFSSFFFIKKERKRKDRNNIISFFFSFLFFFLIEKNVRKGG